MPKASSDTIAESEVEIIMKWARASFRGRELALDMPLKTVFPGDMSLIQCAEEFGFEMPSIGNFYETKTLGDFLNLGRE